MKNILSPKLLYILTSIIFIISCKKPYTVALHPIEQYSYLLYDSIEGVAGNAQHYPLNRTIVLQYDPNTDVYSLGQDVYERNTYWENNGDWEGFHRNGGNFPFILFKGDSLSFHYRGSGGISNPSSRGTRGIKK